MPDAPPRPSSAPPPPAAPPAGPTINIGEEFGTAKRNLPPAKIVLIAIGGRTDRGRSFMSFLKRAKPQGLGSLDNVAAVGNSWAGLHHGRPDLRPDTTPARRFFTFAHRCKARIKAPSGDSTADAVSAVDFDRYFQAFPALKIGAQPAPLEKPKSNPANSSLRTVMVVFPVTLDVFNQRQSIKCSDLALRPDGAGDADEVGWGRVQGASGALGARGSAIGIRRRASDFGVARPGHLFSFPPDDRLRWRSGQPSDRPLRMIWLPPLTGCAFIAHMQTFPRGTLSPMKTGCRFSTVLFVLLLAAVASAAPAKQYLFYVGTYTEEGSKSKGIYAYSLRCRDRQDHPAWPGCGDDQSVVRRTIASERAVSLRGE